MKTNHSSISGLIVLMTIILVSSCRSEIDTAVLSERESRVGFEETVEQIKQNALEAGWTVPIVHDMQANMLNAGVTVLPAKIIEICNAAYAREILEQDRHRYNLAVLPCRVAVYEKEDGNVYISWTNYDQFSQLEHSVSLSLFRSVATGMEEILEPLVN